MSGAIPTKRLLTEREAREVEAALSLAGLSSRAFAERTDLRYPTLREVISRKRVPTQAVAAALAELLAETRWPGREHAP